ncbi:uncharacterized protein L3040_008426 [Drepanopeziza brunnea f. sp. 'multigermtubi']|uniref:Integral membrane protein (Ytp1) n=1 Tax=Marssonina brunnea f. sp. multigermtubi (strain MB_m1) TaxID=1072389 RepID=K1WXU8_MARBU|nr:integral membrane protein (Ytp1) [Drepanopeziza brunnea f. sp. 'multigermtubi' MB_m1]EKD17387.1 integral membrane protein (Ytp1) [Drepanopeziza brunnea f. sp. 'multigermtubi' MB_m1]KAJ5035169.1 hypothetical protein L3040_008426 [Drepanopeziza brunnea f. sp. 'multigermtubi']
MALLNISPFWAVALAIVHSSMDMGVEAHGDVSHIAEGESTSKEPIDTILWIHILLMMLSFGIVFPTGMVLGITRNKWHVPVQVLGTAIAVPAYFLGHLHGGRAFSENIHASFANCLMLMLIVQIVFGIYLKFHITKGFHGKIRKVAVYGHGIVGKAMPVAAWVQMLFGGITALGYCRDDHMGQCLAHFIMGSAFIGYGVVLTIIMLVGQAWLKRTGRSQEFFDSALIAAWGCVNTFTEHRWGSPWAGNDIQHTTMGVIWWCAGLTGIWMSRKRDGSPKRNFVPGFVIFITGWAMSAHSQHLPLSSMVHTVFGYTLMAAGLARIIEICFVLRDRANIGGHDGDVNSWQYMAPFLLYASGFIFMGATEEQMQLISDAGITHVSYILVLYSFAFLVFLFTNMLLHLYAINSSPPVPPKDDERAPRLPRVNGGHAPSDSRQIRDAEEFELEGLISDGEDPESPSTVGRNNETRV